MLVITNSIALIRAGYVLLAPLLIGAVGLAAFPALARRAWHVGIFRGLLIASAMFWLQHFSWAVRTCLGYGADSPSCGTSAAPYSGLHAFTGLAPLVVITVLAWAWRLAERRPRLAALAPVALGFYGLVCYPLLRWHVPPETYVRTSGPDLWLLIHGIASSALLAAYASGAGHASLVLPKMPAERGGAPTPGSS